MTTRPPKKKHPSSRPAPPKSALVLGATGHIGSAVVRELLSRGVRVTAASRRTTPTPNLAGLEITFSPGDADDPAQVDRWTEGHDLVVDAAVPYPLWLFRPETPAEAAPHDYASARTDRILAAARRHRVTLAVVGSFTTLPHPGEARGDIEPAILRRSHPYFAVKEAVESRVLAAARDGLSALIVNPVAVLGPWDGKPREHTFLPELLSGRVPLTSSREASFIDVRDVASALCAAVWAGRTAEKIPLAGHTVRIGDMMDLACSLHGARAPRLPGSTRLGAALSYWAEAAFAVAGRRPPVPALPMLLVRYGYPMPQSPAQRELWPTLRPLADTLRDAVRWYSEIGYLEPAPRA